MWYSIDMDTKKKCSNCVRVMAERSDRPEIFIVPEGCEAEGVTFGLTFLCSKTVSELGFCSRKCLHEWMDKTFDGLESEVLKG